MGRMMNFWQESFSIVNSIICRGLNHLDLTVATKRSKREMRVLEDLYSGTFSGLATPFPNILKKSPQVTSLVTHKTYKNPHWKGLEAHVSPFSMQR